MRAGLAALNGKPIVNCVWAKSTKLAKTSTWAHLTNTGKVLAWPWIEPGTFNATTPARKHEWLFHSPPHQNYSYIVEQLLFSWCHVILTFNCVLVLGLFWLFGTQMAVFGRDNFQNCFGVYL